MTSSATAKRRCGKLTTLTLAVAFSGLSLLATATASAQTPTNQTSNATTQPGWNLRWRRSSKVTPEPVHVPKEDVFARPATTSPRPAQQTRAQQVQVAQTRAPQARVAAVNYQQASHTQRGNTRHENGQVQNAFESAAAAGQLRQAAFNQAADRPVGNYRRPVANQRDLPRSKRNGQQARPDDFFNNPFSEPTQASPAPNQRQAPTQKPVPANVTMREASTRNGIRVAQTPAAPIRRADSIRNVQVPASELAPASQSTLASESMQLPSGSGMQLPSGTAPSRMELPGGTPPPNELPPNALRGNQIESPALPAPRTPEPLQAPNTPADRMPVPQPSLDESPADAGDSIAPNAQGGGANTKEPSPSDRKAGDSLEGYLFENPFNEADREDLRRLQDGKQQADRKIDELGEDGRPSRSEMSPDNELTCEDFRQRIALDTINQVSLDLSPPFRPDLFDPKDYQKQRERFESEQPTRDWRGVDGRTLASGRFVDIAYEQVIIKDANGSQQQVPVSQLSEGDLGYLSENWGLPKECLIEQVAYTPRQWQPLTMTWKASNACSKTRYFEEVNLERYGHTAGPWLQPVVSSAHFFANIAVLPYKMGIHPADECQYALGYYRPGNCAPWIVPPVPISARGALSQAAFMSGAFWMIP